MEHGRQGRLDYGCPGLDVRTCLLYTSHRHVIQSEFAVGFLLVVANLFLDNAQTFYIGR